MKRFCVALCGLWVALTLASCYGGFQPRGGGPPAAVVYTQPRVFELSAPRPIQVHTGRPYATHRYLPRLGLQDRSVAVFIGEGIGLDTKNLFETFKKDSVEDIEQYYLKTLEAIGEEIGLENLQRVTYQDEANLILDGFSFSPYLDESNLITVTLPISHEYSVDYQEEKTFWHRVTQARYPNFDNEKTGIILFNFDFKKVRGRYTEGVPLMHQQYNEEVRDYTRNRSLQEITIERLLTYEFGHYLGLEDLMDESYSLAHPMPLQRHSWGHHWGNRFGGSHGGNRFGGHHWGDRFRGCR